jgi:hypothetical protein
MECYIVGNNQWNSGVAGVGVVLARVRNQIVILGSSGKTMRFPTTRLLEPGIGEPSDVGVIGEFAEQKRLIGKRVLGTSQCGSAGVNGNQERCRSSYETCSAVLWSSTQVSANDGAIVNPMLEMIKFGGAASSPCHPAFYLTQDHSFR